MERVQRVSGWAVLNVISSCFNIDVEQAFVLFHKNKVPSSTCNKHFAGIGDNAYFLMF